QLQKRQSFENAHDPGMAESAPEQLPVQKVRGAPEALENGKTLVAPAHASGNGPVETRHHPCGRALEKSELFHARLDRRDELNRRGACSDDGHPPAGKLMGMVPARG